MDRALLFGILAFVVFLVVARTVLARRSGRDDVDLNTIVFGSALLGGVFTIWAGLKVSGTSLPLGLVMFAIGGVTIILVARMMVADRAASKRPQASTGELTGPSFDYLVWVALGVPMLLVGGLLILAITGGLTSR
jgi:hypothetical protein